MSTSKDFPAFPGSMTNRAKEAFNFFGHEVRPGQQVEFSGMSIRDHFAAKAMQGLIINPATLSAGVPLSARAYEVADAMLAARGG